MGLDFEARLTFRLAARRLLPAGEERLPPDGCESGGAVHRGMSGWRVGRVGRRGRQVVILLRRAAVRVRVFSLTFLTTLIWLNKPCLANFLWI